MLEINILYLYSITIKILKKHIYFISLNNHQKLKKLIAHTEAQIRSPSRAGWLCQCTLILSYLILSYLILSYLILCYVFLSLTLYNDGSASEPLNSILSNLQEKKKHLIKIPLYFNVFDVDKLYFVQIPILHCV